MEPLNIVEVNYDDLVGRIFNGYDLHLSLNEREGISATQFVVTKHSNTPSVHAFDVDEVIHQELRYLERKHSISQLLAPYGRQLLREKAFLQADVVHLHIIHNDTISLLDLPELLARDNVVWTIHDPWVTAGNCVYPLQCEKWRTGCHGCENWNVPGFEMTADRANQRWRLKKEIFSRINPYIVVSTQFMEDYIRNSPLTAHWNRIIRIPFGIKESFLAEFDREMIRKQFEIAPDCCVVGFRLSNNPVKGCRFIFEALEQLDTKIPIQLLIVGEETDLPDSLLQKYSCTCLGWLEEKELIDFYRAADVFLMPSLAESFGLMSVEAMACKTAVICFQTTVLEEVTQAPDCGAAVEYGSSEAIANELLRFLEHPEQLRERQERSRRFVADTYRYDSYVERHLALYQEVKERFHGKNIDYRRPL